MSKSIKAWVAKDIYGTYVFRVRPRLNKGEHLDGLDIDTEDTWEQSNDLLDEALNLGKVSLGLKIGDLKRCTITVD